MKYKKHIVSGLIIFISSCVSRVEANTSIRNDIRNEVNTGGNISNGGNGKDGGTVITGSQKSEVHIKTVVDGETVEDVNESVTGNEQFSVEQSHSVDGEEVHTKIDIGPHPSKNKVGSTTPKVNVGVETGGLPQLEKKPQKLTSTGTSTSKNSSSSLVKAEKTRSNNLAKKILKYVQSLFKK